MASVSDDRVTCAVLIIGDEILSGRTQDTNLRDIARYLNVIGVDLAEARTVPDVMGEIVDALNALLSRYDYVITTGGIGPTHDDITADAVAAAFGVELIEHPEIIAMMQARFQGELNAARRRMARVPVGGALVRNPVQGPPGFTIGNVFTLAGVPQIMRGMLEDVGPRMRGGRPTVSRTVRVEGSGEGAIAAPLEAVAKAHPDMSLGSYPFFGADGYGSNLVIRSRDPDALSGVIEELIALAKKMSSATQRGAILGLTDEEIAFYDALAANESAVVAMGDAKLRLIAAELVTQVRKSVTIDWTLREGAQARIRVMVKRILNKYGYPPDMQDAAVQEVLAQAKELCADWAVAEQA